MSRVKKFHYEGEEKCKLTQLEANKLYEGEEPDVPDLLADYMNMIMTSLFYAPLIPMTIPFAFFGGLFHSLISKKLLLRSNKMPKKVLSHLITSFFINVMPLCVFIWCLAFYCF